MLVIRRLPSLASSLRQLHVSPPTCNLIAPPDPISHMRPIIYTDTPSQSPLPSFVRHPYSLNEFTAEYQNGGKPSELQFKLQRQQLDEFHHNFWFDSNSRFEAAKRAILSSLPSSATSTYKEYALSEFYKQWYLQEAPRTSEYTVEWRRQNFSLIRLAARIEFEKLTHRLSHLFSFQKPGA